ncbi:hypothetical protein [Nostoc sp. CCY 9925]|uniref:hypothetical protein n=1 Tax=Nostoc sp. CCY 9925 TaxID=3103865 RepID=UPI0039C5EFCF
MIYKPKQKSVSLNQATYDRLKDLAEKKGMKLGTLVNFIIFQYLESTKKVEGNNDD